MKQSPGKRFQNMLQDWIPGSGKDPKWATCKTFVGPMLKEQNRKG